MHEMQTKSE